MKSKKTILVAPLNWGLGHATRCIPIINGLLDNNYNVIIGSDGGALLLLKKEFPELDTVLLPSYKITYPRNGSNFKWKLVMKLPHIQKTVKKERKIVAELTNNSKIQGIISDNRLGVRSNNIPSVYITHQINVLSGNTTRLSSFLHQKIIKKFDECWVPDTKTSPNLSGKLGHTNETHLNVKYIGPLSRMQAETLPIKYDVLALLSGPEPQRTLLEEKIIFELFETNKKVLLVQGVVSVQQTTRKLKNITIVNYLLGKQLEKAINESECVLSRSGYTTLMDLATLGKKAFFIPTPGQFEQEYLAKRLKKQGIVPSCKQHKFSEKKLKKVFKYKGLKGFYHSQNISSIFGLFEGE